MLCGRCGHYIDFNFSTTDIDEYYCEKCWSAVLIETQKIQ